MEVSAIEGLLESFAAAALGLEVFDRIRDVNLLARRSSGSKVSGSGPIARAAWHTDRGVASFSATYDEAQSQRVGAQVLEIEWWIGTEHHRGWWHVYPKFPCDWIKGIGRI